jgi:hypothetical protein
MKTNRLSKISLCLAAATLLIVVGFVWLSFPETSSEESHVAGALMSPAIFVIAAMIGVVFGALGLPLRLLPSFERSGRFLFCLHWWRTCQFRSFPALSC